MEGYGWQMGHRRFKAVLMEAQQDLPGFLKISVLKGSWQL